MCTCTSARDETSLAIDLQTKVLEKEMEKEIKILLLGPGESGKSTIFKQMKIIQDNGGFTQEELDSFKDSIFLNCVSQMRCIIEAAVNLSVRFESKEAVECAQHLLKGNPIGTKRLQDSVNFLWSKEMLMVKVLWADAGIRDTYQNRCKFQLNDTANYFFDNIDRISAIDYEPNLDDVLRVRVGSTGIEEAEFFFDRKMYRVVDVGGQRSERRKWIHCFDGVTAVLFCASLSEYDLPLREDPRQNRLKEAVSLFNEVSNQDVFKGKALIVFLNKTDLLQEKILNSPLEAFYKEYKPPTTTDVDSHFIAASEFIKNLFINQIDQTYRPLNTVYTHYTCALDTEKIAFAITAVRKCVLEEVFGKIFI